MRPEITQEEIDFGLDVLKLALSKRLEEKGLGIFVSPHEILGVITEEYKELIDAVHKNDNVKGELLDIAVAAIFGYMSANKLENT